MAQCGLTGRGEDCQFAAMAISRIYSHEDTPAHGAHQEPLPEITHKHSNRLLLCTGGQFGPGAERGRENGTEREKKKFHISETAVLKGIKYVCIEIFWLCLVWC